MTRSSLPYVDQFLEWQRQGTRLPARCHMHYGYWPDPDDADVTPSGYRAAQERMVERHCVEACLQAGTVVLDVGCGFGGTLSSINERIAPVRLLGVNVDPRQVAVARRSVLPATGNSLRFCVGDACDLPAADATVDTLLVVEAIFHFPSRRRFFREARRVLRPGGRLVVSDIVFTARALPLLVLLAPLFLPMLVRTWGRGSIATDRHYRRLAGREGLELVRNEDVTRHVLPNQTVAVADADRWGRLSNAKRRTATILGNLLRLRLLRYRVYSFARPAL